jgi:capsid assembly protease
MMRTLPHVLGRLFNTPLMIAPAKLEALLLALPQVLANRGSSVDAAWMNSIQEELATRMNVDDDGFSSGRDDEPQSRGRGYSMTPGGVAVLPIQGVLVRRPGQMTPDSTPLQSYERIAASIQKAMADSRVKGLLLDVDSPGGESSAVMDLARQVRASTALKPIWAVANDGMFSAAYAIGSAAQRVWVTRTGGVGSVGVMALHADQSQADAQKGVRYTYIHAGDRKIDGNPHGPLAPEAQSRIQGEVDRLYGMFTNTVAAHRAMTPEAVKAQQADVFFADHAVTAGLADQVGTAGEARAALANLVSPPTGRSAAMTTETTAVLSDQQPKPEDPPPPPKPEADPPPAPKPEDPPPAPAPKPADPPPPPAREAARPAPEAADNVVHLDVAQVTAAQKRLDVEIAAACRVAKRPELTEEMIASEMTLQQVQAELLRRVAADTDRVPLQPIDTTHRPPARSSLANLGRDAYAARFSPAQRR